MRRLLPLALVSFLLAFVPARGDAVPASPADSTNTTASAAPGSANATAASASPTPADTALQVGALKAQAHDYAGAIVYLQRAVDLDPQNALAWQLLGTSKRCTGDFPGAAADLTHAIALDPSDFKSYFLRGNARQATGDIPGAEADFAYALAGTKDAKLAATIRPRLADIHHQEAVQKARAHDITGALVDSNHEVELAPTDPQAWYYRGVLKAIAHDSPGALADFSQSLVLDPTNVQAWQLRGELKHDAGDVDGARADYTSALGLATDPQVVAKLRALLANAHPDARLLFPGATINGQPARIVLRPDGGLTLFLPPPAPKCSAWPSGPLPAAPCCGAARPLRSEAAPAQGLSVDATSTGEPAPFAGAAPVAHVPPIDWFGQSVSYGLSESAHLGLNGQNLTVQLPVAAFPGLNYDSNVGWPDVQDNLLVFDPANRTVSAVPQLPAETAAWTKAPVRDGNILILEVPLSDGHSGSIMVDTGDPKGVILAPARWKEWSAAHPGATTADTIQLGALTLSDVPVANESVRITSNDFIARLGLAALARMHLVVDAQGGFAYLQPLPPLASAAPASPPGSVPDWSVAPSVHVDEQNMLRLAILLKMATQDFDGALAGATRALQLYPQNTDFVKILPGAYGMRAVYRLNVKNDPAGAIADINQALALDPKDSQLLLMRAVADSKRADSGQALADVTAAIALDAKNSDAYLMRGMLEAQQKQYAPAAADFQRVQSLHPDNLSLDLVLSPVKYDQGDYAGAIAAAGHYLAHDRSSPQAFVFRGQARLASGDVPGALADYDQAVTLTPQNGSLYAQRALARQVQGNLTGAVADYDQAIALDTRQDNLYPLYLHFLLLQLGRTDNLTHVVAQWTDSWQQALGKYLLGHLEESALLAAAAQGNAHEVPSQQAITAYAIAEMRLSKGDQPGAREYFEKSLALGDPEDLVSQVSRAELARLPATPPK